jgi:hypothetical protein
MNNKLISCRNKIKKPKHLFEIKIIKCRIIFYWEREKIHSYFSTSFVIDPQIYLYHYWLGIMSLAVAYNLLSIPARYLFNSN